jgi:hypothetical protein
MADNFENIIRKAVTEKVSQMADEEIDKACAAFRGKMLAKKPEIVNKIIDSFRFVVKQDGIDGITVQIHMR